MAALLVCLLSPAAERFAHAGNEANPVGAPLAWRQSLGLREESVLPGSEIGTAVLQVSRFKDHRDVDQFVEQVHQAWTAEGSRVMKSRRGSWLLLTRSVGAQVETVEVRSAGLGSEGRAVLASTLSSAGRDPSGDWLRAALSDAEEPEPAITHRDAGRVMTTRVALTSVSVDGAVKALTQELRRQGFQAAQSPEPPSAMRQLAARNGRPGQALLLTRRGEELALTVSDHGLQRAVVLHWGRRP